MSDTILYHTLLPVRTVTLTPDEEHADMHLKGAVISGYVVSVRPVYATGLYAVCFTDPDFERQFPNDVAELLGNFLACPFKGGRWLIAPASNALWPQVENTRYPHAFRPPDAWEMAGLRPTIDEVGRRWRRLPLVLGYQGKPLRMTMGKDGVCHGCPHWHRRLKNECLPLHRNCNVPHLNVAELPYPGYANLPVKSRVDVKDVTPEYRRTYYPKTYDPPRDLALTPLSHLYTADEFVEKIGDLQLWSQGERLGLLPRQQTQLIHRHLCQACLYNDPANRIETFSLVKSRAEQKNLSKNVHRCVKGSYGGFGETQQVWPCPGPVTDEYLESRVPAITLPTWAWQLLAYGGRREIVLPKTLYGVTHTLKGQPLAVRPYDELHVQVRYPSNVINHAIMIKSFGANLLGQELFAHHQNVAQQLETYRIAVDGLAESVNRHWLMRLGLHMLCLGLMDCTHGVYPKTRGIRNKAGHRYPTHLTAAYLDYDHVVGRWELVLLYDNAPDVEWYCHSVRVKEFADLTPFLYYNQGVGHIDLLRWVGQYTPDGWKDNDWHRHGRLERVLEALRLLLWHGHAVTDPGELTNLIDYSAKHCVLDSSIGNVAARSYAKAHCGVELTVHGRPMPPSKLIEPDVV